MLLSFFSFNQDGKPYTLIADDNGVFVRQKIEFGTCLTMKFDTSKRFCVGGHKLGTSERWACPHKTVIDKKYEQCRECMKKTGFNPAFYNANAISAEQAEYNKAEHNLYLAYFGQKNGKSIIKVGISHAKRKLIRLLEQGARAGLILDKFPSASAARHYEAQISKLPGICETLTATTKLGIMTSRPYDYRVAETELLDAKKHIERTLQTRASNAEILDLNGYYGGINDFYGIEDMSAQGMISGEIVACVGSILVVENKGNKLALPLKKFIGYPIETSQRAEIIELGVRQASLF